MSPPTTAAVGGPSLLKRVASPTGVTVLALLALLVYAGITLIPTLLAEDAPPVGVLVLTTLPPGAAISVDGQDSGKRTPARLENIAAGVEKEITFTLKGYETHTETIGVTAADVKTETREVKRRVFLKKSKGTLSVTSTPPGAEVYLDARYIGNTPHEELNLARDKNELRLVLRKEGFRDYPAVLTWNDEVKLELDVTMKKRGN